MILTCPSCSARFLVDPRAIGAKGRTVRCGKCKHEWRATVPLAMLQAEGIAPIPAKVKPIPAGSGLPVPVKEGTTTPLRSVVFAVIAALLLAMPLLAMKISPYMAHSAMKQEKASPVMLEGTPVTRLRQEEGRPVLDIEGVIVNRSGKRQPVPVLKAAAKNARGTVVREWTIPLTAQQLEAGQRLPFSFSTPLPDQGVEDIGFHLL